MSQHALRGATWMAAAGLLVSGVGGVIHALAVGVLFLMPSAAAAISATSALIVLAAKIGVAVLLLSRLAKDHLATEPPWLALILLIVLGLTGIALNIGSGLGQPFLIRRAADVGELDVVGYLSFQSVLGAVTSVLNPLIHVGTLIGAAWLWQSAHRSSNAGDPLHAASPSP